MQLVFEIRWPRISGNLERVIIYTEPQSYPAPGRDLIKFFLSEIADATGHQGQSTRPCERLLIRRKAAIAIAKSYVDHDLVALGGVRKQQDPDSVGQFQLFNAKALNLLRRFDRPFFPNFFQ